MYGAYRPECVGQHGPNVRISAMFWGWVTYSGVGTLVPIKNENMNSEKNIETLDKNYGYSLQNILEISIYTPGWQCPIAWFPINNCLGKWKWFRLSSVSCFPVKTASIRFQ